MMLPCNAIGAAADNGRCHLELTVTLLHRPVLQHMPALVNHWIGDGHQGRSAADRDLYPEIAMEVLKFFGGIAENFLVYTNKAQSVRPALPRSPPFPPHPGAENSCCELLLPRAGRVVHVRAAAAGGGLDAQLSNGGVDGRPGRWANADAAVPASGGTAGPAD